MSTTTERPPMDFIIDLEKRWHQVATRDAVPKPKEFMDLYRPMHFERTRAGEYHIKTERSRSFEVVNQRMAYMLGVNQTKVDFGSEIEFHKLTSKRGTLTSDAPIEIYSQYMSFRHMHGRVLVTGLGLGMAAEMILRLPTVTSVTVVEKDKHIIELIEDQIDAGIAIVQADAFKYLADKSHAGEFDSAYHDIWYTNNESCFTEFIIPLYRASRALGIDTVHGWGEYEMRAEIRPALFKRAYLPEQFSDWKPYKVFYQGMKRTIGQPTFPDKEADVLKLIELYVTQVGTAEWERVFDWEKHQ